MDVWIFAGCWHKHLHRLSLDFCSLHGLEFPLWSWLMDPLDSASGVDAWVDILVLSEMHRFCFEFSSSKDGSSPFSCFHASNRSSGVESEAPGCASLCSVLSPVSYVEPKVCYWATQPLDVHLSLKLFTFSPHKLDGVDALICCLINHIKEMTGLLTGPGFVAHLTSGLCEESIA